MNGNQKAELDLHDFLDSTALRSVWGNLGFFAYNFQYLLPVILSTVWANFMGDFVFIAIVATNQMLHPEGIVRTPIISAAARNFSFR